MKVNKQLEVIMLILMAMYVQYDFPLLSVFTYAVALAIGIKETVMGLLSWRNHNESERHTDDNKRS